MVLRKEIPVRPLFLQQHRRGGRGAGRQHRFLRHGGLRVRPLPDPRQEHPVLPRDFNHHAAQIDLRKSVEDPKEDAEINILGLINLMEAAVKAGSVKKIVFASTGGAIYGDADKIPTAEDYPAWPVSPYGITKLISEHYLHYYQQVQGIPFVSLRYGNVYGPRQNPEGEAGVIAIFSKKILENAQPVINRDGNQTRDFVFVEDVVEANISVLKQDISGIYNIATGIETSINSIYSKLAQIFNFKNKALHATPKPGEQQRSALDCSKAKTAFNWEAKTSFDEGLQKTAEFFQKQ